MARISKSDLIEKVAKELSIPATTARRTVGMALNIIESHLRQGDEVALQDFGTFKVAQAPARTMVDHLHGKGELKVPARKRARFVPSKNLLS